MTDGRKGINTDCKGICTDNNKLSTENETTPSGSLSERGLHRNDNALLRKNDLGRDSNSSWKTPSKLKEEVQTIIDIMGPSLSPKFCYNTSSEADNEDSTITNSKYSSVQVKILGCDCTGSFENADDPDVPCKDETNISTAADINTSSRSNTMDDLTDSKAIFPYDENIQCMCPPPFPSNMRVNSECFCPQFVSMMNGSMYPAYAPANSGPDVPARNSYMECSTQNDQIEIKHSKDSKNVVMNWLKTIVSSQRSINKDCDCQYYKMNVKKNRSDDNSPPRRVVFDLVQGASKSDQNNIMITESVQKTCCMPKDRKNTDNEKIADLQAPASCHKYPSASKYVSDCPTVLKKPMEKTTYCDTGGKTRVDVYYFDHGSFNHYRTTDAPPLVSTEEIADKTEKHTTRFWAEIFGTLHIGMSFVTSFLLQFLRFFLYSICRPLTIGVIQLTSDYFFKPMLATLFNGVIQPALIFFYNMTSSIRDLCEPVAEGFGYFMRELAVLSSKEFRFRDIGNTASNDSYRRQTRKLVAEVCEIVFQQVKDQLKYKNTDWRQINVQKMATKVYSIKNIEEVLKFDGKVENIKISRLTAPGENYLSLVLRVDFEVKKDGHANNISTVAKRIPLNKDENDLGMHSHAMTSEIKWYLDILPLLKEFASKNGIKMDFYPVLIGSRYNLDSSKEEADKESVLFLENLIPQGYENEDRYIGFDLITSKAILKNLAVFHALPIVIKTSKPELHEIIKNYLEKSRPRPPVKNDSSHPDGAKDSQALPPGVDKPEDLLIEALGNMSNIAPYMSRIKPLFGKSAHEVRRLTKEPWNTTAHNDFWVNNIMVKYEKDKEPLVKILDFQMCHYGPFAKDVVFFLFTSVRNDITREYMDELLRFYYDEFMSVLRKTNAKLELTFEEYLEEISTAAGLSEIAHAIFFSTMIFGEKGTVVNTFVDEFDPLQRMNNRIKNMTQLQKEKLSLIISEAVKRNWI